MKDIADLIGRILIGAFFLLQGLDIIFYFAKNKETLSHYNIEWNQDLILFLGATLLILSAITVLIGYFGRLGAFILLVYWLVYTFIVYSWWNDPEELKLLHSIMFIRNMALCGGIFIFLANGAGKYSIKRLIHVLKLPK